MIFNKTAIRTERLVRLPNADEAERQPPGIKQN